MKVSPQFRQAFYEVCHAFGLSESEIAEAKAAVAHDYDASIIHYCSDAAILRAGWNPNAEQISDFKRRTVIDLSALARELIEQELRPNSRAA